ncbi:hypothetical protein EV702DRAFT_58381 [Suillus placidus]|uniref:Uncharacterized protein n=1 Tax=Suillus placidus TaxID=48579 RepID=A0A9P7D5P7_9AGAM|nr:hypothetical protein EV702DRAFT_58381 [Suillus placidus]
MTALTYTLSSFSVTIIRAIDTTEPSPQRDQSNTNKRTATNSMYWCMSLAFMPMSRQGEHLETVRQNRCPCTHHG